MFAPALFIAGFASVAWPQTDQEYTRRLGQMQSFIKGRRDDVKTGAMGIASELTFGREASTQHSYRVGEAWTVLFFPTDDARTRMSGSPLELSARARREPSRYELRVLAVDATGHARFELRASPNDGRAPLIFSDQGGRVGVFGFGTYPIGMPDLSRAASSPLAPREVPPELRHRDGFDPSRATDYRAFDDLARPVRVIWVEGDAWPVYMRTTAGTAVRMAEGGK